MTIRTDEFDILQPVIGSISIDVMKFQRNQLTIPLNPIAVLTAVFLKSFVDKSLLQSPGILNFAFDKNLFDWARSVVVTLPTQNCLS